METKQPHTVSRRNIKEFLLGFGLLLPNRNFCMPEDEIDKTSFKEITTVDVRQFNAALLEALVGVHFAW